MSEKFLQALAEDPKLEKQIGCMTGLLQIFDRQQYLTGKRLGYKRLTSKAMQSLLPPNMANMESQLAEGDKDGTIQNNEISCEKLQSLVSQSQPCEDSKQIRNLSSMEEKDPANSVSSFKLPNGSSSNKKDSCINPDEESKQSSNDCMQINAAKFQDQYSFQGRLSFNANDCPTCQNSEQKSTEATRSEKCRARGGKETAEQTRNDPKKSSQGFRQSAKASKSMPDNKTVDGSADVKPRTQAKTPRNSVLKSKDQSISYAELKESLKVLSKLKDAPWNMDREKVSARALGDARDGGSRNASFKDLPRISYDGRDAPRTSFECKDAFRAAQRSKDGPRISLDGMEPPKPYIEFQNSLRSHSYKDNLRSFFDEKNSPRILTDTTHLQSQFRRDLSTATSAKDGAPEVKVRSPGVVARLMGLEEMPHKPSSCSSTPTKRSTGAKLLQGLLDYTPLQMQQTGADSSSPIEINKGCCEKNSRLTKQQSAAADFLLSNDSAKSRIFRGKYANQQDHSAQLYKATLQSSGDASKCFIEVLPQQDSVVKPLAVPRYVMETMPPQHKFKPLLQQKFSRDSASTNSSPARTMRNFSHVFSDEEMEKPSRKLRPSREIGQQKTLEEILEAMQLKGLLHLEQLKAHERPPQPEKAKLVEVYSRQAHIMGCPPGRKLHFEKEREPHQSCSHSSISDEDEMVAILKADVPRSFSSKKFQISKQQLNHTSNCLKSLRTVKGSNSAESCPAREFPRAVSGSSSKPSPRETCREAESPRSSGACKIMLNRPSKPQKISEFAKLPQNRCDYQCQGQKTSMDSPNAKLSPADILQLSPKASFGVAHRNKADMCSPTSNSPDIKICPRSVIHWDESVVRNSSSGRRGGILANAITQGDGVALDFIKCIQDDVSERDDSFHHTSNMQPEEGAFLQRSNSDMEIPSLESYESENQDSEGDATSHRNFDIPFVESSNEISSRSCSDLKLQAGAGFTIYDENVGEEYRTAHPGRNNSCRDSTANKMGEQVFPANEVDRRGLPQREADVQQNCLESIPLNNGNPTAILPSVAASFITLSQDYNDDEHSIGNLVKRFQRNEVLSKVSLPSIETPQGSINVLMESNESKEKHPEQPSPVSVLEAAAILNNCSPKMCRADGHLDFELNFSIPMPEGQNGSKINDSLMRTEVGTESHKQILHDRDDLLKNASLMKVKNDLTKIPDSFAKGELQEACYGTTKIMLTETEERVYVQQILLASGFIAEEELAALRRSSMEDQIQSNLMCTLEPENIQIGLKSDANSCYKDRFSMNRSALIYRRLLFDAVNDILETRLEGEIPQSCYDLAHSRQPKKQTGQKIIDIVCSELHSLCNHPYSDISEMLYSMVNKDVNRMDHWQNEPLDIVVSIERLIFKQLVEEVINVLIPSYGGKCGIADFNCRKKLF